MRIISEKGFSPVCPSVLAVIHRSTIPAPSGLDCFPCMAPIPLICGLSAGPDYCGTAADVVFAGGTAWSNVTNAEGSTNWFGLAAAATVTIPALSDSDWLYFTNFGFALPADAAVTGIMAEIMGQSSSTATNVTHANLVIGGSTTGTNLASTPKLIVSVPNPPAIVSFGNSSELWGTAVTGAQVNASNFGFAIVVHATALSSRTPSIFGARVTVYYCSSLG